MVLICHTSLGLNVKMAKKDHKKTPPDMSEIMDYLEKQSRPVSQKELNRTFGLRGDNRVQVKKMMKYMT